MLIHLLDDFVIISPPNAIPAANIITVQRIFARNPHCAGEILRINSIHRIPGHQPRFSKIPSFAAEGKKIDRIILVASSLAESQNSSKHDLLSFLGHLVTNPPRPPLYLPLRKLDDQIIINQACCNELSLWITFLKQWNGLTFFYNDLVSLPDDIQLFTDAAPSVGYGGFLACNQFIITVRHVPGSKNQIADSLSHFMFQKFRALALEADPSPTPVPHYSQLIFP
ncbi:hypothetical protein M9458_055414 [Cirrhinus mrigala]|uniref:Reverse transcriptase domain-containing protein n=1 Tax=Cirrhinus mrigala TaxID=683832 RepID=A0ABD0ML68_CIRMR